MPGHPEGSDLRYVNDYWSEQIDLICAPGIKMQIASRRT
jgi:hypothetical protein